MRVCIELRRNNASKTFIGLSFRTCNIVENDSPPLYFVNLKMDLLSKECIFPVMIPETRHNLDLWDIFARGKFDDVSLFDFHIFDTFPRIE
jgi:hypothetical protein